MNRKPLCLSSAASWLAPELTWSLNPDTTCLVVNTPTTAANAAKITNVSTADPPARRHRIGTVLYAENVACAADRV